MSRYVDELAALCRARLFAEKWVLAPSHRVGNQWLERVARAGGGVVNARIATPRSLAFMLAAEDLARQGAIFLDDVGGALVVEEVWATLPGAAKVYFQDLLPTPTFFAQLRDTLQELRLAGADASTLPVGALEVEAKRDALAALGRAYGERLACDNLVDYAGVLTLAVGRLGREPSPLAADAVVILAADLELKELERRLLAVLGTERVVTIAIDDERVAPAGGSRVFRAVGEVNEVREVFRRCLAGVIPWDEVEVIYTDRATYVPLLYEEMARLYPPEANAGGADLWPPVTFQDGVPARYARPGRALRAWVAWVRDGYPQETLARMVQDGLILVRGAGAGDVPFHRLADALRSVAVGAGRERYLPKLQAATAAVDRRLANPYVGEDEDPEETKARRRRDEVRRDDLNALALLVDELLAYTLEANDVPGILEGASRFFDTKADACLARCVGPFDKYARAFFFQRVGELRAWLEVAPAGKSLDAWGWLDSLADEGVRGLGPRPGCLYATPLSGGGYSGRRYTYILGLDDARFPGGANQDPLLLDHERRAVAATVPTAEGRLADKVAAFRRLVGRLEGDVTLSYTARAVDDGRELFPSPAVVGAFRALTDKPEGDLRDLAAWLDAQGPPASFAPADPVTALDEAEWWLARLCGRAIPDAPGAVFNRYPYLEAGARARAARAGDAFTEYDGLVPAAAAAADFTRPGGPVASASRLERLGRCPREFFFHYLLGLEPPDYREVAGDRWLEPVDQGSLLHRTFYRFIHGLIKAGQLPDAGRRDGPALAAILAEEVAAARETTPPPSEAVYRNDVRGLSAAAEIFLRDGAALLASATPAFLEVALGMPAENEPTPFDIAEPVPITLPGGGVIRARGRIDRIDRDDTGALTMWDYKTGSPRKYDRNDPFRGGRVVQNALYVALLRARLAACPDVGGEVAGFSYFFTGEKGQGEVFRWGAAALARGLDVVAALCRVAAAGAYPAASEEEDCLSWCDFARICRGVADVADAGRKLEADGNDVLAAWRGLREADRDG